MPEPQRFVVKRHGLGVYFIKDNDAKQYRMPEMAVSIYFSDRQRATEVCVALNKEWSNFLANPS